MRKTFFILIGVICISMLAFSQVKKQVTPQSSNSQSGMHNVTGKIVDEKGDAIIGVSIKVKGSTNGTISDVSGEFSLSTSDDAILSISYIGYESQEVAVNNQSRLSLQLKEKATGLNEVVVVGYGTQKKVNLTGAVASVGGEVLNDRPISNLGQGLQGLIPNLNISTGTGLPGSGSTFNIRGNTSINGGSPLILVDGVQMDPNLINPEDVASVSVLKDAASAAIYGARGAYGVILITTKEGQTDQKVKISFNVNEGLHQPETSPHDPNSLDYANYTNLITSNSGWGSPFYDAEYMSHIKAYMANPTPANSVFIHSNSSNPNNYDYCGNTDWYNVIFKNIALDQNYDLNLSGGNKNTKYYTSMGLEDDGGLMKVFPDQYKRWNINFNLQSQITKWLQVSERVKYNNTYQHLPSSTRYKNWSYIFSSDLRPLMPEYNPDGHFSGEGYWTNPASLAAQGGYSNTKNNDLWITGAIKITPIKGFEINSDYTFNYYNSDYMQYQRSFLEYNAVPGTEKYYPWTTPSYVQNNSENDYYAAFNAYMDYTKQLGKHYFKAMIGYNQENKTYRGYGAQRTDLIDNDLPFIGLASGPISLTNDQSSAWAVQGLFTRINYNYDERYLVEFDGRDDASSKFPSGHQSTFFPSASIGWNLANEKFMKLTRNVIDVIKLRGSYGTLGNQALTSNFPYYPSYGVNTQYSYLLGGNNLPVAVSVPGLVSSNFTWETVKQIDGGLDFAMLNNRFSGSFDWYNRQTLDMLAPSTVFPSTLGTSAPNVNSANMNTKGWELSLKWRNHTSGGFNYNIGLSLSDYLSTITKYNNPSGLLSNYYVGEKLGDIWGFVTEGLFQNQAEIDKSANQSALYGGTWYPGDVRYKDLNGDGKIDNGNNTVSNHGDQKVLGNTTPRYQFGVTVSGDYKGFDFNMFFQGVLKEDFMPYDQEFWGASSEWGVPSTFVINNYWTPTNTNGYLPRQSFNMWSGDVKPQTRYLQSAAYARLKQFTIGYTIPKNITEKANIEKVRIYFTGQNLFTLKSLPAMYDPETLAINAYPIQRIFSFGINVSL